METKESFDHPLLISPEKWELGAAIYDMHNSYYHLLLHVEIGTRVDFRAHCRLVPVEDKPGKFTTKHDDLLFSKWLAEVSQPYINKMLVLISEPDAEGFWTAAYSYDDRIGGVMRIKPKEKLNERGSIKRARTALGSIL